MNELKNDLQVTPLLKCGESPQQHRTTKRKNPYWLLTHQRQIFRVTTVCLCFLVYWVAPRYIYGINYQSYLWPDPKDDDPEVVCRRTYLQCLRSLPIRTVHNKRQSCDEICRNLIPRRNNQHRHHNVIRGSIQKLFLQDRILHQTNQLRGRRW